MKQFLLLGLLTCLAFGNVESRIESVNDTKVTIQVVTGLKNGESAYVVREFDAEHATVIAECTIDDAVNGTMNCHPFEHLYHESLTLVGDDIKAGDKVYAGLMSDSVAIIAPNQTLYLQVKEMRKNSIIFHPDLMASTLKYDDNPTPGEEEFKAFCKKNFIGVLVFVLNDGIYDVDCNSFKVIGKEEGNFSDKENNKPFYHRVGEIERGFFDFSDEAVTDFTAYYKKVIGIE